MSDIIGAAVQHKKNKNGGKIGAGGFQALGLSGKLLQAILRKGYRVPTPIQRKVIPDAILGKDIVAMARTGSGKSAAFLIPLIQKLNNHSRVYGVRAIVVSPTRELALQTSKFLADFARFTDLRQAVILGGESLEEQFNLISNNPDIIIATPGRLVHILDMTKLSLQKVEFVVFDEADQLFEMGLFDQVMELVKALPESRQTLLISATLPQALVEFSKVGLHNPSVIRLDVENSLSELLNLSFIVVRQEEKVAMLMHILRNQIPKTEQAIIFASTKYHVEYLYKLARTARLPSTFLYGEMDAFGRKNNLAKFSSGNIRFCFVTDVAARGIDIPKLDNVINFDFPSRSKLFVHRVGRVARAGRSGKAISLLTPDEIPHMIDVHTFLGYKLQNVVPEGKNADEVVNQPLNPYYGKAPSRLLEAELDSVRNLMQNQGKDSEELKGMEAVCEKAFKLYVKMRSAPSPDAIKRAKGLSVSMEIHPCFMSYIDSADHSQIEMISSLKNFRPNNTIFELGKQSDVMKTRRNVHQLILSKPILQKDAEEEQNNDSTNTEIVEAPKEKESLSVLDSLLNEKNPAQINKRSKKAQKEKAIKTDYRDPKFFLSTHVDAQTSFKEEHLSVQSSKSASDLLNNYSLDLDGDDAESMMRKKRQTRKWDPKKKKFVNAVEETKSSNKIQKKTDDPATKKNNAYTIWKKKSRQVIPTTGSREDEEIENPDLIQTMRKAKSRFRAKTANNTKMPDSESSTGTNLDWDGLKKQKPLLKKNPLAKSELQSAHSILKKRKRQSRESERLSRKKSRK
jgi:ATP-dependent RNA helicase DDX54/DBP10